MLISLVVGMLANQPPVFNLAYYTSPLIAGLALALIASGFGGVLQYWRELVCLSIFMAGPGSEAISSTLFDAQFAHFLLWYAGWDVARVGSQIILPQGAIDIERGCSSLLFILNLLTLVMLLCSFIRFSRRQKVWLLGLTIAGGFLFNAIRIGFLGWLIAYQTSTAFHYWHSGQGGAVLTMIAALLLIGVALLLKQFTSKNPPLSP
jgi:cyanoexosortase A